MTRSLRPGETANLANSVHRQLSTYGLARTAAGVMLIATVLLTSVGNANPPKRVSARFESRGVSTVIIRAFGASEMRVQSDASAQEIRISGIAMGGAGGYHSPDPNWKETPPEEWNLGFVGKRFEDVLVVSTRNEIGFIHHFYHLDSLHLIIPPTVTVKRVKRDLNGDGAPDLTAPK